MDIQLSVNFNRKDGCYLLLLSHLIMSRHVMMKL